MDGKIYINEVVENKDRRFGSALTYVPAMIVHADGSEEPALFTKNQITEAMARAASNPEDIPERKGFLARIFG